MHLKCRSSLVNAIWTLLNCFFFCSACQKRGKKHSNRSATRRSTLQCVQGVLCASNSRQKINEDDVDPRKRPIEAPRDANTASQYSLTSSTQQERNSDSRLADSPSVVSPGTPRAHSRVEKLHTDLKLPDGRIFSLPVCVDLALNLLHNSFDRFVESFTCDNFVNYRFVAVFHSSLRLPRV